MRLESAMSTPIASEAADKLIRQLSQTTCRHECGDCRDGRSDPQGESSQNVVRLSKWEFKLWRAGSDPRPRLAVENSIWELSVIAEAGPPPLIDLVKCRRRSKSNSVNQESEREFEPCVV